MAAAIDSLDGLDNKLFPSKRLAELGRAMLADEGSKVA